MCPVPSRPPACLPAVLAISSLDRKVGCWAWWEDCYDVQDLVKDWLREWG